MTLTWVRDTKAKEKPTAPNNPILDIELEITISLEYKGAPHKKCSWFLWALAQSAREPISGPQMGPGGPTNSPRRSWGRDGGMGVWWIHLESKRRSLPTCLSFSHTWLPRIFSVCVTTTIHSTDSPLNCRLTVTLWDTGDVATWKKPYHRCIHILVNQSINQSVTFYFYSPKTKSLGDLYILVVLCYLCYSALKIMPNNSFCFHAVTIRGPTCAIRLMIQSSLYGTDVTFLMALPQWSLITVIHCQR